MDHHRLAALLAGCQGKRILVVGDCMLDEYVWGRVGRISPEAPVMVVEQERTTYAAGGASNVAANIVAMDGAATIVAVVGDDPAGLMLRKELEKQGVNPDGLVTQTDRPTTTKTRVVAHSQQVLRIDREERSPITSETAALVLEQVAEEVKRADALLLSDYSKGVLTSLVVTQAVAMARDAHKPVFANAKPASINHYQGLDYIQLNQSEAEAVTDVRLDELTRVEDAGARLLRMCNTEAAIITLGGRGMALFQRGAAWKHLPVISPEVYDACGCGDTSIAAATLARVAGADWVEAATVANLAGNAKVGKLGVQPVSGKEIEGVWAMSHKLNGNGKSAHGPVAGVRRIATMH